MQYARQYAFRAPILAPFSLTLSFISRAHYVTLSAQSAPSQAASHGTVSQTVSIDDFVTREEADADSERAEAYYYPSRCGDDFRVGVEQLEAGNGEVVLGCEGCTERIRVVYEIASEE